MITYYNIINEMLDETEHAQLIGCATDFINAQDEICSLKSPGDDKFIITFEMSGNKYKIEGKIENGDINFFGFYKESDYFDDNIAVNYLSSEGFKNALSTRNIYPLVKNKVLGIISKNNY